MSAHEPTAIDEARAQFGRQFSWPAFLIPILWYPAHGLWVRAALFTMLLPLGLGLIVGWLEAIVPVRELRLGYITVYVAFAAWFARDARSLYIRRHPSHSPESLKARERAWLAVALFIQAIAIGGLLLRL